MPANPSVFVSHSHLDNAFGLRLIADLRARLGDDNVWYDVSGGLHGGDEWWREIVRQITARDVFLVILSPNALASPFVQREMAMAYQLHMTRNKRLLPIRYQPCDLEIDWEIIQWLPCHDPQTDQASFTHDVSDIVADLLRPSGSGAQPQQTSSVQPVPVPAPARTAPAALPPYGYPAGGQDAPGIGDYVGQPGDTLGDNMPAWMRAVQGLALSQQRQRLPSGALGSAGVSPAPTREGVSFGEMLSEETLPNWLSSSAAAPNHFPQRLASLGFVAQVINGVEVITPPLCDVPAGPFLMGSNKRRDKDAQDNELPQHTVTLATYQLARHPITNAEYTCYLHATGRRPYDVKLDHPVIISWDEAMAYVAWLARATGQPWRLPTEAEWEKAARGTDGRIYPWGDQWDESHANTLDGGPRQTTPIGTYPSGASPYGAQDMAGNVWEWTSTLYRELYSYAYNPEVSEDGGKDRTGIRVLRGGSWLYPHVGARAAYRLKANPLIRDYLSGFRVVRGAGAP